MSELTKSRRYSLCVAPLSLGAALMLSALPVAPVLAQTSDPSAIETVVVTAEKRQENVNTIGMSIQAFTGDELKQQRVTNVQDLGTVVPSFNVSQGYEGVPIFTLRGIGFNTINLSATSTVGTYVDEVAYAYPFMMSGPLFDVQRVEVLEGPQGTLYGRNTTAGLIDFITNKPTDTFDASLTAEGGNYDTYNFEGHINGQLADGLDGRVAFRTEDSDEGWQVSDTRPGDRLGQKHNYGARGELVWNPREQLTVSLTADGWINQSDSEAAQVIGLAGTNQAPSILYGLQAPGLLNYIATHEPTSGSQANWEPASQRSETIGTGLGMSQPLAEDDHFYSLVGRVDYTLNQDVSLVSLTAFNHVDRNGTNDWSGSPYEILVENEVGHVNSFSEELRLQGDQGPLHWLFGGYYANDTIVDGDRTMLGQNANVTYIRLAGLGILSNPLLNAIYNTNGYTPLQMSEAFRTYADTGSVDSNTSSVFVNGDWKFADDFKLTAGARYTQDNQQFAGCSYDVNGNMLPNVNVVNRLLYTKGTNIPPEISEGDCVTFNDTTRTFGLIQNALREDNVAWRINLDWTPITDTLFYASASEGYKAGDIPIIAANISTQEAPAKQERLLAYETGVKTTLANDRVQLNLAGFYYDYGDKQLSGFFADPIYGALGRLVNIPTSNADGIDGSATWAITDELTALASVTYVHTYIGNYVGVNQYGLSQQYEGSQFSYSPNWQGAITLSYVRPISADLAFDATINEHLQSKSCADLCDDPAFHISGYGLLNVSVGIKSQDGAWDFALWARNLTDTYYWNSVADNADLLVRFPGQTRTFGLSLTHNFQ